MENWTELYMELADKVAEIEGIKWVDLWHNQVNFLEDEHNFPSPSVFLAFRTIGELEDLGENMQKVPIQIEAYLFYETFADTFKGAVNQGSALEFLELMKDIHAKLHGSEGSSYTDMKRTGFSPVDTGSAGNLYLITFECSVVDSSAAKQWEDVKDLEVDEVESYTPAEPVPPDEPMFIIPE